VDIMVSTGLRFELDKAEDGQMVYRLEPYVDRSFVLIRLILTDLF
jgi:hypothetical protein